MCYNASMDNCLGIALGGLLFGSRPSGAGCTAPRMGQAGARGADYYKEVMR